jgi:hypothetical protein
MSDLQHVPNLDDQPLQSLQKWIAANALTSFGGVVETHQRNQTDPPVPSLDGNYSHGRLQDTCELSELSEGSRHTLVSGPTAFGIDLEPRSLVHKPELVVSNLSLGQDAVVAASMIHNNSEPQVLDTTLGQGETFSAPMSPMGKRYLPGNKKPDAAITFPEKVREGKEQARNNQVNIRTIFLLFGTVFLLLKAHANDEVGNRERP